MLPPYAPPKYDTKYKTRTTRQNGKYVHGRGEPGTPAQHTGRRTILLQRYCNSIPVSLKSSVSSPLFKPFSTAVSHYIEYSYDTIEINYRRIETYSKYINSVLVQ